MDRTAQNKRYYAMHAEELRAKRNAKTRQKRNATLVALITNYVEGMTIKELCDKYKVLERK